MKHNQAQSESLWRRISQRLPKHSATEPTSSTFVDNLDTNTKKKPTTETTMSRVARKKASEQAFNDARTVHPDMRRRLNWAIGIVVVLIIIVYLVLFFV